MIQYFFEYIYSMSIYDLFNNYEYIGEGSDRIVFGIDNYIAVKRAKTKRGYKQCNKEKSVYEKADDYLKEYLCPILWFKNGMIVMPRAIPLRYLTGTKTIDTSKIRYGKDIYNDLKKMAKSYGLYLTDLLSSSSWGLVNNRILLIDYGCSGLTNN